MKGKIIRYKKATRERLIELLERIGYKVTNQSSDGTWKLIRLPNGESTGYWIVGDNEPKIEHRIDDNRGGLSFYLKECLFELYDEETVCVLGAQNKSLFISFHNFKVHKEIAEREAKQ